MKTNGVRCRPSAMRISPVVKQTAPNNSHNRSYVERLKVSMAVTLSAGRCSDRGDFFNRAA